VIPCPHCAHPNPDGEGAILCAGCGQTFDSAAQDPKILGDADVSDVSGHNEFYTGDAAPAAAEAAALPPTSSQNAEMDSLLGDGLRPADPAEQTAVEGFDQQQDADKPEFDAVTERRRTPRSSLKSGVLEPNSAGAFEVWHAQSMGSKIAILFVVVALLSVGGLGVAGMLRTGHTTMYLLDEHVLLLEPDIEALNDGSTPLERGSRVRAFEQFGDYLLVQDMQGRAGYVLAALLNEDPPDTLPERFGFVDCFPAFGEEGSQGCKVRAQEQHQICQDQCPSAIEESCFAACDGHLTACEGSCDNPPKKIPRCEPCKKCRACAKVSSPGSKASSKASRKKSRRKRRRRR